MGKNIIGGIPNWLLLVVAVGFLWQGGYLSGLGASVGTPASPGQPTPIAGLSCDTSSFDVSAYDFAQAGTALATNSYKLFYDGNIISGVSGTAITTQQPGKSYNLIASRSGYYNASVTGSFDECRVTDMAKLSDEAIFTRYQFFNPGTATNNTNASAFAIGSGATETFDVYLKCNGGDAYDYCVDPVGGYLVVSLDVNTSEFDTSAGKTELINGVDTIVERIPVPIVDSGIGEVAFKVTPTKQVKSYDTLHFKVKLGARESVNPMGGAAGGNQCLGTTSSAGGTFASLRIRESSWTVNTLTGQPIYGVEDNAGTGIFPLQTEMICYS